MDAILAEIKAERERQDAKWGGAKYDDGHPPEDWVSLLGDRVEKVSIEIEPWYANRPGEYRRRLIQVAAVAVAAVEAWERQEQYNKDWISQ